MHAAAAAPRRAGVARAGAHPNHLRLAPRRRLPPARAADAADHQPGSTSDGTTTPTTTRSATPTRTAELEPSPPPSVSFSSSDDDDGGGGGGGNSNRPRRRKDAAATAERAAQYNQMMKERMGWRDPYQYHPELGLYHHEVAPGVIVGTQPRGRREVDRLLDETGAAAILCLQEDRDAEHWGVDLGRVRRHTEHRLGREGSHLRVPAKDFDGDSLRLVLPRAVALLQRELEQGRRVYVHCTAGLGRAPAVAIAWRYWFYRGDEDEDEEEAEEQEGEEEGEGEGPSSFSLDAAYGAVTSIRPCGPRRESIRGATVDLLLRASSGGGGEQQVVDLSTLPEEAGATLTRAEREAVQRAAMAALLRGPGDGRW
jgi:hypothetical protein